MKLYATDNSELMTVVRIHRQDGNLLLDGTIMGAMPIRAVLKPAEVRRAFGLMDLRTLWFAFTMLFRASR